MKITTKILIFAAIYSFSSSQPSLAAPLNNNNNTERATAPPTTGTSPAMEGNEGLRNTEGTTDSGTSPAVEESEGRRQGEGMSEQQLQQQAQGVQRMAQTTGTAAYILYHYLRTNYLTQDPTPQPPCFIEERTAEEIDGKPHPGLDYVQRLVEDYRSLRGFSNYWEQVREYFNDTLTSDPSCDYCTRFIDLLTSTSNLQNSLIQLIASASASALDQLEQEELEGSLLATSLPDHCSAVSYEQQGRVLLRYQAFSTVYLVSDIQGFLEQ